MTSVLRNFLWGRGGINIYIAKQRMMRQVIQRGGCSAQARCELS